jgi:hypothetical protein
MDALRAGISCYHPPIDDRPDATAPMISDDEKAKLKFDLANANMQSIGRAQGLYVTTLLTYVCIVWALFFVGSGNAILHLGPLDLNINGVWSITPFVLLVLTLAYIGSVTAATPAFKRLREAQKELFGSHEHSFFDLDSHKNIIDYLAILQLWPTGNTRTPKDDDGSESFWHRLHHLILPNIFVGSALTSYWAIHELSALGRCYRVPLLFGRCFLGLQIAYSLRPMRRLMWRFFGAKRTSDVFN